MALKKLGWRKVGALTQDGAKYSDYMSTLQVGFSVFNVAAKGFSEIESFTNKNHARMGDQYLMSTILGF